MLHFFSRPQLKQLLKNGSPGETRKDHFPVEKLFLPKTGILFLLTEINPTDPLMAYGLCDFGAGEPFLSRLNLEGIARLKNDYGERVRRDPDFTGKYPISVYLRAAQRLGYFTEQDGYLRTVPLKPNGPS